MLTNRSKPPWVENFKDLPSIPINKRWRSQLKTTIEQDICIKLQNDQSISNSEKDVLEELNSFCDKLNVGLQNVDFGCFTDSEVEQFEGYILYAFTYPPIIFDDLYFDFTYRLVLNESVSGENKSLNNIKFLQYPSIEKVKQLNTFNRASTPNSTVFYTAQTIKTSILERRPPLNKIITIGVLSPKIEGARFVYYPITHSPAAYKVNESVRKATDAIQNSEFYNKSPIKNLYKNYYELLGREFTKKVTHHYEYIISAVFSENIFSCLNSNGQPLYDMIKYPSVGASFLSENLAISPNAVNRLELKKVIEFEIVQEFYDAYNGQCDIKEFDLVNFYNYRETEEITKDGLIIW